MEEMGLNEMRKNLDLSFYQGKRVMVTGHTGFKGSWLCKILIDSGAEVAGYALEPPTNPSLFDMLGLQEKMYSVIGDIRDYEKLKELFGIVNPQIVFHLAAQPLVRKSYQFPRDTYETNIMGTVNILECVRQSKSVKSFLNITTDKVYKNREWEWGYRENEELNGFDPYSNSKSCSELITDSYTNSFFSDNSGMMRIAISTARAGNVIGGGDFAADRIVPDCIRAAIKGEEIVVRNPYSIRPYQHVLDPLCAYLLIAQKQFGNAKYAGSYNVGPNDKDCYQTGDLVDVFAKCWGNDMKWVSVYDGGPHEANFLKLDCSKIKKIFGWNPVWNLEQAVEKTVEWSKCWLNGGDISLCMEKQIKEFLEGRG